VPLCTASDFANWGKDDTEQDCIPLADDQPDMEEAYPLLIAASAMVPAHPPPLRLSTLTYSCSVEINKTPFLKFATYGMLP
jgi:hypothetical protein